MINYEVYVLLASEVIFFCNFVQDKAVPIPERPKDWKPRDAPDFVRFYMGERKIVFIYVPLVVCMRCCQIVAEAVIIGVWFNIYHK